MKINKTRVISTILTITSLLSCLSFTVQGEEILDLPLIRMTGGQAPLTDMVNPEISYNSSYDLSPDAMAAIIEKIKPPLLDAAKRLDWQEAGRIGGAFLWEVFGDLQIFPDGTSRNWIYRQETTPAADYDDKAYASPKHENPPSYPLEEYKALFEVNGETGTSSDMPENEDTSPENLEDKPQNEYAAEKVGIFKRAGIFLSDGFFNLYFSAQKRAVKRGLASYQPEPDPAWREVPAVTPAVYKFAFDWRQSPIDVADQLHDYVLAVKAHTGAKSVYIQSLSASGTVALAYIDKYINGENSGDVAGIFMSVPLALGMGIIGAGYQKKIYPDARALAFAEEIPFGGKFSPRVRALLNTLHATGILDLLCSLFQYLPSEFFDSMYDSALIPLYGTFLGIWASVPPDMYESAKTICFGTQEQIDQMGYTDFFVKSDAYHALQVNSHEILQQAAEKIKLAVVAGYGLSSWPVATRQGLQSDSAAETVYASFGATVSNLGETLGRKYRQFDDTCGHNHISPDNNIDASTAALPEHTWFVKGVIHGEQNEWNGLFSWWYSTEAPTVNSSERWPQFLCAYGERDKNGQEGVFPLSAPAFDGSDRAFRFSVWWNKGLTRWNGVVFSLCAGQFSPSTYKKWSTN
ncbi:MAG: hypothetical protein FWG82_03420 [Oscillospiraceae bacterium]|nr:hypothetical protein [Oscillospiraceae bacterium]